MESNDSTNRNVSASQPATNRSFNQSFNNNNNTQQRSFSTNAGQQPQSSFGGGFNDAGASAAPNCPCGNQAKLLQVKKEGANKGRGFYTCAQLSGPKCEFFEWAGDGGSGSVGGSASSGGLNNNRNSGVSCDCGTEAVSRTVSKEGANKGKQFYSCPKRECDFFSWADEGGGSSGGGGSSSSWGTSSGRGRGGPGGGGGSGGSAARGGAREAGTVKKRKCGICGTEGHTRIKCPSNGGADVGSSSGGRGRGGGGGGGGRGKGKLGMISPPDFW